MLIVLSDNLESSSDQVQSGLLHSSTSCFLALLHPFKLLLESEEPSLNVAVGFFLGSVSFDFCDQSPWSQMSYLPQQLIVEVGRPGEELVQPGLQGLHQHQVFIIFHFFVCIGVGKYFFDKGGVVTGPVAGQARHHSSREESDPVGLLPDVFLEREHEVRSPLGVISEIPLGAGMVGGLILPESGGKFLQSFVPYLVSVPMLLQFLPMKVFAVFDFDGFDEALGHLHDGFGIVRGKGKEVFSRPWREGLRSQGLVDEGGNR
jgi:hypothetical protein